MSNDPKYLEDHGLEEYNAFCYAEHIQGWRFNQILEVSGVMYIEMVFCKNSTFEFTDQEGNVIAQFHGNTTALGIAQLALHYVSVHQIDIDVSSEDFEKGVTIDSSFPDEHSWTAAISKILAVFSRNKRLDSVSTKNSPVYGVAVPVR